MRRGSKNFIVQPSEFCWERCGTNQAKFGRLFSFVPWGGRCSTSFPAKFARLDDEIAGSANWLAWGISLDREELMIPRGWNLTVHLKLKFRSTSRSLKNSPRFPGCPDENHENNARKDCGRDLKFHTTVRTPVLTECLREILVTWKTLGFCAEVVHCDYPIVSCFELLNMHLYRGLKRFNKFDFLPVFCLRDTPREPGNHEFGTKPGLEFLDKGLVESQIC